MKIYNYIFRIALLSVVLLVVVLPAHASSVDVKSLWEEGKSAYAAEDYDVAIAKFRAIAEMGNESDVLYYNLGNAYFKRGEGNVNAQGVAFNSGELGRAILNYERALKINPEMEDARYNLAIATKLTNAPEEVPVGFMTSVWRSMSRALGSNTWAILSLVMLFVTLALVLVYLLANNITARKVSFFISIATLLAFILTTAFALSQRSMQLDRSRAVVVCNSTQAVHSEPNHRSKVIREPMQGVIVEVLRSDNAWSEVKFADGEKGWVRTDYIEVI